MAGEDLTAGNVIVLNANDRRVKATISNQGAIPKQAYIVKKNVASGNIVEYYISGIVQGLSGLTRGTKYYISSTAGALTASRNGGFLVGIAASSSALLLQNSFVEIVAGDIFTLLRDTNTYYAGGSTYQQTGSFVANDDMIIRFYGDIFLSNSGIVYLWGRVNGTQVFDDLNNNTPLGITYTHDVTLTKGQTFTWGTRKATGSGGIRNCYIKCEYLVNYK